jgi:MFS family permease
VTYRWPQSRSALRAGKSASPASVITYFVNVGLRDIGAEIGGSSLGDLSWILNAYAIVFAALLVPAGRLADRYGNKRAFLAALAFVPDVRASVETRIPDLLGGLLLILGTGSLALGLVQGPDWGWGSASTLGTFAVTVVGTALFVLRSRRHMVGGGGILIGVSIGASPDYVAEILPGWSIIGAGVGFAMPTLVAAGTAGLPPHQTSTGRAIRQMARWIGSAIGVAVLVIVLGASVVSADQVDRFTDALWWEGGFSLIGAVAALAVRPRSVAVASAPAVEA